MHTAWPRFGGSPVHITLASRVGDAIPAAAWAGANVAAAAAAATQSACTRGRLQQIAQPAATAEYSTAAALTAADGAVIANEALTGTVRYAAFFAAAGVVGGMDRTEQHGQQNEEGSSPTHVI